PLAVVTGASSGIGYELARQCAQNGFDLVIAADRAEIGQAAQTLRAMGVNVDQMQVDLSTTDGVDRLCGLINGRPVEALLANAGNGLGGAFLDEDISQALHVVHTNITGTIY